MLACVTQGLCQTYPAPFLNTPLVPAAISPGGRGFVLTVNGTGFTAQSVVRWNGSPRKTTFVSNTQLTANIHASDVATATTASVTVSNPGPHRSNPVFFQVTTPEQGITMQVINTGLSGTATAVDVNGDGIADLVVLQSFDVLVALGQGGGVFGKPQDISFPVPVAAVAFADSQGNGKPDMAVSTVSGLAVLQNDGTGKFGQVRPVTNLYFSALATADLDGDGWVDLVGTQQTTPGYVSVILHNPDGSFKSPVSYQVGNNPISVAVGDFNRDGILDLAVLNQADDSISILLGNGDGTFQPPLNNPTGGPGDGPTGLVVADFNGDGNLDLARAAALFTAGTGVLLGNGDGTFQPVHDYTNSSYGLVTGDFTGDGILDLAMGLNGTGTGILIGKGDGTFPTLDNFDFADHGFNVSAADFNNNGRLDLAATTSNGVVVLMQ
jgi:hypothetical protein